MAERGELGEVALFTVCYVSWCLGDENGSSVSHEKIGDVGQQRIAAGRRVTCVWDLQVVVHLLECLLGLGEEVVDDGFGELALFLVIVHFEDLGSRKDRW